MEAADPDTYIALAAQSAPTFRRGGRPMGNRLVDKLERFARMSPGDAALLDTLASTKIRRSEAGEDLHLDREGSHIGAIEGRSDRWIVDIERGRCRF
jgi:hypothetical protein